MHAHRSSSRDAPKVTLLQLLGINAVASSVDSDLEMFSHNPADGRFGRGYILCIKYVHEDNEHKSPCKPQTFVQQSCD